MIRQETREASFEQRNPVTHKCLSFAWMEMRMNLQHRKIAPVSECLAPKYDELTNDQVTASKKVDTLGY